MNSNNPFEYMQSFMNQQNLTKTMEEMLVSGVSNAWKQTAEALSAAHHTTSKTIQSIVKKSADTMQKNTTELYNTMKEAVSAGDVDQASSCQQKYLQSMADNHLSNTKEIFDISTKSMTELLNIIQSNLRANTNNISTKPKKE